MMRNHNGGFTQLELLVSIAIIVAMAGVMVPTIAMIRDMAERSKCSANMRQIGMAASVYATDNRGFLPIGHVLDGNEDGYHQTSSYSTAWRSYFAANAIDGQQMFGKVMACPAANRLMGVQGQRSAISNQSVIQQYQPPYGSSFTRVLSIHFSAQCAFMLDAGCFNYNSGGGFFQAGAMNQPPLMPHLASGGFVQTNAAPAYANNNQGLGYYASGTTVVLFFDFHAASLKLDPSAQRPGMVPWANPGGGRPGSPYRSTWNLFWNDSSSAQ